MCWLLVSLPTISLSVPQWRINTLAGVDDSKTKLSPPSLVFPSHPPSAIYIRPTVLFSLTLSYIDCRPMPPNSNDVVVKPIC